MLFRRIVLSACCVGLLSGLLMTVMQQFWTTPIILSAETYENTVAPEHRDKPEGTQHGHGQHSWSPRAGTERLFYSFVANVIAGIGFALVLIALMSLVQQRGLTRVNSWRGLVWGGAGYVALFMAPAIGLAPEIPGLNTAPLEQRQLWWVFAASTTAVGLGLIAFAPKALKVSGGVFLVLPHLFGAPRVAGPAFSHADPEAVAMLNHLHSEFIVASGVVNLVFWIVLGVLCTWALYRWVLTAS